MRMTIVAGLSVLAALAGAAAQTHPRPAAGPDTLKPLVITERVQHDTDDPAIWVNAKDPARSLIIGTDKNVDGALYAFDLTGKVVRRVGGLKRPNNVDLEYGFKLGGKSVDIVVTTERLGDTIRVFSAPDLLPIDGGPIPVFEGEAERGPMGVALYKRPRDGAIFAVLSRKSGPREGYLWQYRLEDDGRGRVKATKVRAFGAYGGEGEIEAVAVDDALGYVYYTDEWKGVRKYGADPDAVDANRELALFGGDGFTEDREGVSIYAIDDGTGYILVSDQQANKFHVFPREGTKGNPHDHPRLKVVSVAANHSDGSDVTSAALGRSFPDGLFVAMSDDGVFHYYSWPQIAGSDLTVARGGRRPAGKP